MNARVQALRAGVLAAAVLAALPAAAIDFGGIMNTARRVADAAKPMAEQPDEAAQEKLIGEQAAQEILSRAPLAPLPALQKYINQLGRYVAAKSERKDVNWRFGVVDDASANAWAAPDGYIFVTTGMLSDIGSEAELAGVLAHEIEHVVQRHHLKAIQAANQRSTLTALAGIAVDTADVSTPSVSPELEALRGSIDQLYERGLGRGDELDADRRGVELAGRAGYDPYGLPLVLQKLEARGKDDASMAVFTRTHPSIPDRLAKLEQVIEKLDPSYFPGRTQEQRYRKFVQL
jgi:predicted Zn-dependent protease